MRNRQSRRIKRQWEWEFSAPPAALWPPLADGTVRRVGTVRRFGFTLSWEEGVPQWVAGQRFAHERLFASGPLRRVATEIEMAPAAGGHSRVCYRLSIDAR